jgi:hypothetical protein
MTPRQLLPKCRDDRARIRPSAECLNLEVQLLGFRDWRHFLGRDLGALLSPLDDLISEEKSTARDEFQGYARGPIARKLLALREPLAVLWDSRQRRLQADAPAACHPLPRPPRSRVGCRGDDGR